MFSGYQELKWTGTSSKGQPLKSGIYFVSIETKTSKKVVKVVLD